MPRILTELPTEMLWNFYHATAPFKEHAVEEWLLQELTRRGFLVRIR